MGKQDELVTGIDKFLEIVNSRSTVAALDASKELGVAEETVEIWAEVLGQDGLVSIEYDGRGKMILKSSKKQAENSASCESSGKRETAQKSTIIETLAKRKKGSILRPRISSKILLKRARDGANAAAGGLKKESISERILKKLGFNRGENR